MREPKLCADKRFWEQFLKLYRSLPALWQIKNPGYRDGVAKAEAYEKLVHKLKERYIEADRDMAIKKIITFRNNYKRFYKKLGESDNFPWYFPLLRFLDDLDAPVIPYDETEPSMFEETNEVTKRASKKPILYRETAPVRCVDFSKLAKEINVSHEKKRKISDEDPLIRSSGEQVPAKFSEDLCSSPTESTDEHYSRAWAAELQKIDPIQSKMATKIISVILFQGSIGNVKPSHAIEIQNILNNQDHESPPSPRSMDEQSDT